MVDKLLRITTLWIRLEADTSISPLRKAIATALLASSCTVCYFLNLESSIFTCSRAVWTTIEKISSRLWNSSGRTSFSTWIRREQNICRLLSTRMRTTKKKKLRRVIEPKSLRKKWDKSSVERFNPQFLLPLMTWTTLSVKQPKNSLILQWIQTRSLRVLLSKWSKTIYFRIEIINNIISIWA